MSILSSSVELYEFMLYKAKVGDVFTFEEDYLYGNFIKLDGSLLDADEAMLRGFYWSDDYGIIIPKGSMMKMTFGPDSSGSCLFEIGGIELVFCVFTLSDRRNKLVLSSDSFERL